VRTRNGVTPALIISAPLLSMRRDIVRRGGQAR
jgi:hypothetical protein